MGLDILSRLKALKWRGIEVPALANDLTFEHGHAEHYQYGVDGAFVEHTGRKSARMSFQIPFHVGIGQYKDLYPDRFRDFWNACNDGSVGKLQHPEFGEIDAKVLTFKLSANPQRRGGYDVDVVWVETVEKGKTITSNANGPIQAAVALAKDLESDAANVELPEEDDDISFGQAIDRVKKAVNQVKGSIALAQYSISGTLSSIDGAIGACNDAIDVVNYMSTGVAFTFLDTVKKIEAKLAEARDKVAGAQESRIDYIIAQREIAVSDAAAKASMQIDEFLSMNPRLAKSKSISSGTEYFVRVK